MKTNKFKLIGLFLACFWLTQSCTDGFEDLNTDPKNPTKTTFPALFNGVIKDLPLAYNEMSAIHFGRYYFQSQQLGNAKPTYPLTSGSDDIWSNYYFSLKNIRLMESLLAGDKGELKLDNAKACLDILLAYKTLRMVDYVGDMPYFNAGKGGDGPNFFKVAYDKQQDIYKDCITKQVNASTILKVDATQYTYGNGDTFLKGDITLWKKFANALILRYAIQAATADAGYYGPIVAQILNDPTKYPMLTGTETVGLWPSRLGNWMPDSHPWSFRENNNSCMGTAMWKIMSSNDSTDGSGIFDPRCYVFFEPNLNGEWKAYPQSPTDQTAVQERGPYKSDAYPNGRSKGQTLQEWSNKGTGCRFSPVNFYLAMNNDYIPEIMATVAEVHLLTAEAYNRGLGVTKNTTKAKSEYEEGIKSSLSFWYSQVVLPCAQWIINKPTLTQAQIDAYMTKVAYSANETTALQQIYAQLWIDSFREPWLGFNLYRRTLATPRDESAPYNANDYKFYKVPYPESEKLYNLDNYKAATGDINTSDKKLFWQK